MYVIGLIINPGKLASTGHLDEDVGHLCEQVYKLLGYMQEPMLSGNLVSLTQTVKVDLEPDHVCCHVSRGLFQAQIKW